MKKPFIFETQTWLPQPREQVFEFFKNAENLQTLTPPWLNFEILTPLPIAMRKDTLIDYRLKLYGVRFHWKTLITDWQPPHFFVDQQIGGPYKLWIHTHRFEEKNGGTLMQDRVEYVPRGRLLAALINKLFVRKNLEKIFEYRRAQISQLFEPITTEH